MNAMIIINGRCYEVGPSVIWRDIPLHGEYLYSDGTLSKKTVPRCSVGLEVRYTLLTPIPDDDERAVQWRLGESLWKLIPDGSKPRVHGEIRPTNGAEEYLSVGGMKYYHCHSANNRIILSPPHEPEKTLRQAFQEFVDASTNATWKDWADWSEKREAAVQFLADME